MDISLDLSKNNLALEMKNITKSFFDGKLIANNKVSFKGHYGQVIGLVGENGAGKSTLVSILFGLYMPEEGEILINNKKVQINSPFISNKLGIGMVPQHFKLVNNMTVTENIMLGIEKTKHKFILDRNTVREEIIKISKKFNLEIDPNAKISDLSIGLKQRVEIIKVLFRKSKIIILDEPTSVLTPLEAKQLIKIIHTFKKYNKLIIFISHKLNEIMEASDRIVIMRKGIVTGDILKKDATPDILSKMMVGESINLHFTKKQILKKEIHLSIKNLFYKKTGINYLNNINLDIFKGEIVGFVGIAGNGHGKLIQIISQTLKATKGEIINFQEKTFEYKENKSKILQKIYKYFWNKKQANNKFLSGFGYIPPQIEKEGALLKLNFFENMVFNRLNDFSKKWGLIDFKKRQKFTDQIIKDYHIEGANKGESIFKNLSGGNRQKAVSGREIEYASSLLIAAHPTRGIDIGAIKRIYNKMINKSSEENTTIILLSGELDELIAVCNRLVVFFKGEIMGIVKPEDINRENIGLMMTGTRLEDLKL